MQYRRFFFYNIIGGCGWVASMVLGGYFLASLVPNIGQQIHWVIAVVIVLSFVPAGLEVLRARASEPVPLPTDES